MSRLFLCEKPSQARDIARVLGAKQKGEGCLQGSGVVVTWCIGHLLHMSPPEAYNEAYKRWDLADLPITPKSWQLEVSKSGRKQFNLVKRCLSQASEIVIATDAVREGETIAREILELCLWKGPILRLWLSALDETSIRKGLYALLPGDKSAPLYLAGLGRARADWLVGMNLSRLYSLIAQKAGHRGVLSVGRVQTPTLNLVVARDLTIEGFRAIPYFELLAFFKTTKGSFQAKWIVPEALADPDGHCLNKEQALSIGNKIQGATGHISKSERRHLSESPPLPFDLSSLQQEASRRFAMKVQDVLNVAQSLYETHKAITYPRTDCAYLPESQHQDAPKVLAMLKTSDSALHGLLNKADHRIKSRAWNEKKITAHHAIIPNVPDSGTADVSKMTEAERRIYTLILYRYIAQFFPDHRYDQTTVEVKVEDEIFRTTGRQTTTQGWKAVFEDVLQRQGEENRTQEDAPLSVPPLILGDPAVAMSTEIKPRQTQPPPRFTEGTLIAAMKTVSRQVEDRNQKSILKATAGLGTEATRASIIETLLKRNLVARQKKHIIGTATGRALIAAIPESVKDPSVTARWEQALEEISNGKGSLDTFLQAQQAWISSQIETSLKTPETQPIFVPPSEAGAQSKVALGACPACKQAVHEN